MSIMDVQNLFDDAAAITSTRNSTNVIDLGVARDIGRGRGIRLVAKVGTAFTASGSATLTPSIVVADDAALTTNPVTLWTGAAIAKATLVAGYKLIDMVLPNFGTKKRFIGLVWTVATGPMTAGTVTAGLQLDEGQIASEQQYATASNTSF
jgi:hypothetical protein